jgi:8-oxo-dGTP pyrophosphatase MutT (NUDIX family)
MLEVAKRELAEETGTLAKTWQNLGAVDICNGVANDVQSLFLATDLSKTSQNLDPEEDIVVRWVPFGEAVQMAMNGRITEVCTIAALLKVALLRTSTLAQNGND